MATLYSAADVARAAGVSVQAIWNRRERGTMPRPVHMTARGRPLWTRASLIAEGVLSVGEDGMTDAERVTAIGRGNRSEATS